MKYQNPILHGMYPDPSIVLVDDTYYLVNSTFEYYPGIALSKSKDLVNWERMPGIAKSPKQADLRTSKSNEGIFAVCIRHYEGHFYVVTTNFAEFKTFIIRGTFNEDKSAIIWENDRVEVNVMGIDPDLYFEDGRTYLQFNGYIDDKGTKAIQQVEINLEDGKILRGPEVIAFGTGGRDVEGPHILKQKGYYYLLTAEGGTGQGHMVIMFRSKELWGPYENEVGVNPLFTNRDRAEQPLQNIGHSDLFQDVNGNWWLVCLGTRPANVGFSQITNIGRETLLYPVDWSGIWPKIYKGVPEKEVDLTDFPEHAKTIGVQASADFEDDFKDGLKNDWLTLRDSLKDKLQVKDGLLELYGQEKKLSELGTPSFVGLRQADHEEVLTVEVSEETDLKEGAAGIVSLINVDHYAGLILKKTEQGYDLYRLQQVADVVVNQKVGHLTSLPEKLELINSAATKTFTAYAKEQKVSFEMAAINLSNEALAALNTGDIEGLFAYGNAKLTVTKVKREVNADVESK